MPLSKVPLCLLLQWWHSQNYHLDKTCTDVWFWLVNWQSSIHVWYLPWGDPMHNTVGLLWTLHAEERTNERHL